MGNTKAKWRQDVGKIGGLTRVCAPDDPKLIDARRELSGVIELERTLDYGSFKVRDRVRLMPEHRTEIRTAAGASWPASRMSITIEEPSPEALFLRFVYEAESEVLGEGGLDEMTVALRQQAYEGTDLDTVVRIRALVEAGRLG